MVYGGFDGWFMGVLEGQLVFGVWVVGLWGVLGGGVGFWVILELKLVFWGGFWRFEDGSWEILRGF